MCGEWCHVCESVVVYGNRDNSNKMQAVYVYKCLYMSQRIGLSSSGKTQHTSAHMYSIRRPRIRQAAKDPTHARAAATDVSIRQHPYSIRQRIRIAYVGHLNTGSTIPNERERSSHRRQNASA